MDASNRYIFHYEYWTADWFFSLLVPVVECLVLGGGAVSPWIKAKPRPLVAPGPRREVVGQRGQDELKAVGGYAGQGVQRVLRPDGPVLQAVLQIKSSGSDQKML